MRSPIQIGGRRELFLDDLMIAGIEAGAEKRLHHPERREIVLEVNEPHEKSDVSNYHSIVKDGNRWLYYYRAYARTGRGDDNTPILCVAETKDGIHFKRCEVNLLPEGPNVVLNTAMTKCLAKQTNTLPAVTTVFADSNPDCKADERIKMIVSDECSAKDGGMYLFVSADGFKFRLKHRKKFQVSKKANYDTNNLAFYDPSIGEYRLYHRAYRYYAGEMRRMIIMNRTKDFVHFQPNDEYVNFNERFEKLFYEGQELYTNQIQPYFRAPHIMIGFPTRYYAGKNDAFMADPWDAAILNLPAPEWRAKCSSESLRSGMALTENVLIAGRDGLNFTGYGEAFMRPGPQRDEAAWFYGDNYLAYGMIPTKSHLEHGAADEISLYYMESYRSGTWSTVRRCAIRMDGFVSIHFPEEFRRMTTRPFVFKGGCLTLNIESGAFGRFRVGFFDEDGNPIPEYTLADSLEQTGDGIELIARWHEHGSDLRPLEGKVVSMVIEARDTDFYSFQFVPWKPDPELPQLDVIWAPVERSYPHPSK